MKIVLTYIYVSKPSEGGDYSDVHDRFVRTYEMFRPKTDHKLLVICYGGDPKRAEMQRFGSQSSGFIGSLAYYGGGLDCGAAVFASQVIDCDLLICCNSQIHFWRAGWMERLVAAFEKHGPGLYSPFGSYENTPHLRTPCLAFPPKLLRTFPFLVHNRTTANAFESGPNNVTQWVRQQGLPTVMVTWNEVLPQQAWRKPANCFRRGDQSDLLVFDRHSKLWSELPEGDPQKLELSRSADGISHK